MPALNYTQFVEKVENGSKRCTIRADRKVPIKQGDTLHHFTGMRRSACRRLRVPEKCISAPSIVIMLNKDREVVIVVGSKILTPEDIILLSQLDGFEHVDEFLEFFLPGETTYFRGQLIAW
jgi:hypothetical protein